MTVRILTGDCREVLRTLPDESVHCVVTSPPYWGLRDYGIPPSIWGGDPNCEHAWGDVGPCHHPGQVEQTKWKNAEAAGKGQTAGSGQFCQLCNAWRGVIGLEPTYQLYITHMVEVFRETKRVLRTDGTCWLNLGDSYCADRGNSAEKPGYDNKAAAGHADLHIRKSKIAGQGGLKPKDLCGIPWRVAFALQADGWWLRQDIIWSKPNPMPESVRDRCTKAHEYIFLLSKNERYHFEAEAIAEPSIYAPGQSAEVEREKGYYNGKWKEPSHGWRNDGPFKAIRETRNKRSVWEVATAPFSEAHFATFPPKLIESCILAGCPMSGTVLDPFGGAGTTGLVADRLGRNAILIELNPEYVALAERRINSDAGMFADVFSERSAA